MTLSEQKQKIEAASKLLSEESTTLEKFDSANKLLVGINPKIDKNLQTASEILLGIENIQSGEVIDLIVKKIPENNPEEKRRKKAILAFLKTYRELKSEVDRVMGEIENLSDDGGEKPTSKEQITSFGKIAAHARGPFGIITILALVIAGTVIYVNKSQTPAKEFSSNSSSVQIRQKVQVIDFNGKKIPLSELEARTGLDCKVSGAEAPHFHAKNGQFAKALDGTQISDPGACAYGKVEETNIEEIQTP